MRNNKIDKNKHDANSVRVLFSSMLGHFIEFYDFAIYSLSVMAIVQNFFPNDKKGVALISAFAVYGVAFLARPIGGIVFGKLGDRLGRKHILIITISGMGIATTIMGLLPSYDLIGIWAPILLLVCRLVQGFSAGGEVTGATAFVIEHAPPHRRGYWTCLIVSCSAVPPVLGAILILGISSALSEHEFYAWGWRLAFLFSAPMTIIALYIRNKTQDLHGFESNDSPQMRSDSDRAPMSGFRVDVVKVFFIMALNAASFYFLVGYFVTYLQSTISLSSSQALISNAVALLGLAIFLPVFARMADRSGRRKFIIWGALYIMLASLPVFYLVTLQNFNLALLSQLLLSMGLAFYGAGSYPLFLEMFPTRIRLTASAYSYTLSYAIFGGFAPMAATLLVSLIGSPMAPAIYLLVISAVSFLVSLTLPETYRKDLC